VRVEPIVEVASKHGIPVLNPSSLKESIDQIKGFNADIGVLVAYGKIIPQEIIDVFPLGIINLHPSLLPKLRGSTPIETALLEGLTETGVSIMEITKAMDAGDVYAQTTVTIPSPTSKQELADLLHQKGSALLLESINNLDDIQKTPQDHAAATFTRQITKDDSIIDISKSAQQLEREITAYSGWPGSWYDFGNLRVKITEAATEDIPIDCDKWIIYQSAIYLKCVDGKHLRIDRLQPENKKEMPVKAFLAGYADKLAN
jgi:methionyl-tRNA formyltransferase